DLPRWLDPRLRTALAARGIDRLYSHQAEAMEAVRAHEDVVVVTPTASGKTLCYALPTLQLIAEDPAARALFLFPTKALGQDQVAEIGALSQAAGLTIAAACYDGDTPAPIRSRVRAAGQTARRPAVHRRGDGHARLRADPRRAVGPAVPPSRAADDRLRPLAHGGRDPPHRAAREAPRELRTPLAGARLPRRLPADGATVDRARPARRRDSRRSRDERPRARRGHWPPRRGDPRRIPGLGRGDVEAVRTCRTAPGEERRRGRRERRGCGPVRRPPSRVPARGN